MYMCCFRFFFQIKKKFRFSARQILIWREFHLVGVATLKFLCTTILDVKLVQVFEGMNYVLPRLGVGEKPGSWILHISARVLQPIRESFFFFSWVFRWNNWQKHFLPVKKTDSEFMGWVTCYHDILKHTIHWMPRAGCSSVVFSKELGHTVLTVQLEGQSWPMSLHRKKDRVSSKGRTSSLFPINYTDYRGLLHCDLHLHILITFKHWVLRSANYVSMRCNLRTKKPNPLCGWVSIVSFTHLFCLVLSCLCCASVSLHWVSPYKPYGD